MAECFFISDPAVWNALLRPLPCAHILQTWEWGEFKRRTTGWTPERLVFRQGDQVVAAAQILTRRVGPLRVMYVPKGPALDYADSGLLATVLDRLQTLARQRGAIWLKIDPDVVAGTGIPVTDKTSPPAPLSVYGEGGPGIDSPSLLAGRGTREGGDDPTGQAVLRTLQARGWRFSADQVQFRNTITVDLTRSADDLLLAMSQSTRRKVRTAEKKGVTVRPAGMDDIPTLYELYRATGERDGFLIRPLEYYRDAWGTFMQAGLAQAFLAEAEGRPIAHVILLHFGRKCWYFYGASSNEARERMPNYALQWAAMQWAQAQGYPVYDFWGAPDVFEESDRLWGVYQFKRGFGGVITRHIGAWDYAPYPALYRAYTILMPRVLGLMRRRTD